MIVKELIEKLKTFDENLKVVVDGYEEDFDDIKEKNIKILTLYHSNPSDSPNYITYYGEYGGGFIINPNSTCKEDKYIEGDDPKYECLILPRR